MIQQVTVQYVTKKKEGRRKTDKSKEGRGAEGQINNKIIDNETKIHQSNKYGKSCDANEQILLF